ncbi:MAG: V-type ATP synthase subunit I [Thermoplasmata archaeon]
MGILRPAKMEKIGIAGLQSDREAILTLLHDLGIAQIEPLSADALHYLTPERPSEMQRRIGEALLRFRGLKTALPGVRVPKRRRFRNLEEVLAVAASVSIDEEVAQLRREEDRLTTERKAAEDDLEILRQISFYPDRLAYLTSKSVVSFFTEGPAVALDALRARLGATDAQFLVGGDDPKLRRAIVTVRADAAETLNRLVQVPGLKLVALPRGQETPEREAALREERRKAIEGRLSEIRTRLSEIARAHFATVAAVEEALAIENRKAEVYAKLGVGRESFALEAWIPQRDRAHLARDLEQVSGGRAVLTTIPTRDPPPTLMDNPRGIRGFEFFIRFYSLPQAGEWDPTFVFAIVFPIFFGLMLGDWGYGLTILLICLWMIRGFPGVRYLPKMGRNFVKMIMGPNAMRQLAWALLPGCAVAIGLGLYWDEFFGYPLLHNLFGYTPAVAPLVNVGLLLLIAGYIGLGMITLGFLLGALHEHFIGHDRGAWGKVGGILFAWGIAFFGLAVIRHQINFSTNPLVYVYLGLLIGGVALLFIAEGPMGLMGLMEIVSHILSYTRLIGILLASVILAVIFNVIAGGLFGRATPFDILAALVILLVGQSFNTILGVFEPGIQGARLIFVEHFSKYYHGNGRGFTPLRSSRQYTEPVDDPSAPSGPTIP